MQTQPNEMISRVAWAILDAGGTDSLNLDAARAAIEAMREPTRQMEDRGQTALEAKPPSGAWQTQSDDVWRAMIDEALGA